MTGDELKAECKFWGLPVTGRKSVLIHRLETNIKGQKILPFKITVTMPIKRQREPSIVDVIDDDNNNIDDDDDDLQPSQKEPKLDDDDRSSSSNSSDDDNSASKKTEADNEFSQECSVNNDVTKDDDQPSPKSALSATSDHALISKHPPDVFKVQGKFIRQDLHNIRI